MKKTIFLLHKHHHSLRFEAKYKHPITKFTYRYLMNTVKQDSYFLMKDRILNNVLLSIILEKIIFLKKENTVFTSVDASCLLLFFCHFDFYSDCP
jgi:hypothetical protein